MCIACELGYLSMIDALEAERRAAEKRNQGEPVLTCEPTAEPAISSEGRSLQRLADEPAP